MQASTHICVGGHIEREKRMTYMWLGWWWCHLTNIQSCVLVKIAEMKVQEVGKNPKSCLWAWALLGYYKDDDAFLRSLFLIVCYSAQPQTVAVYHETLTLGELQLTGELSQKLVYWHLKHCKYVHLTYHEKPSVSECFLLFWSELLITFDMW